MDKEQKAYENLIQTINSSTSTADQGHYKRQLQFLSDFKAQPLTGPYGENASTQLAQLLETEALLSSTNGNDDSLLNAWLLWLNELLQSKRWELLGETHPLLQFLLQYVEQKKCSVDALRCLHSLLETLFMSTAKTIFPRLALIPLPSNVEASLLLVRCQHKVFRSLFGVNINSSEFEPQELQVCGQLANALLQSHYDGRWVSGTAALLVAHSLELLMDIIVVLDDFAQEHAPELLGLALAYVRSRADDSTVSLPLPHRIHPAQHLAVYGHDEDNQQTSAAGRRIKSRKMRSLTKQRNNGNASGNVHETAPPLPGHEDRIKVLLHNKDNGCYTSSGGDSESGGDSQRKQRQAQVKVRIEALRLIGLVSRKLPRRALYGYWHALFPSDGGAVKDHLLHIGASDGHVHCRALALQVAAQLLYGSKPYLSQASSTSTPSSYTPFALSVASSVLAAYRQLTSILERECAPNVLTQCLKCLAVLVQATPFEQLEMGIVYDFVPHVKTLTRHRDTSVKVSALLVMEMLVAMPRLNQEMACAVGMPLIERRAPNFNKNHELEQHSVDKEDEQEEDDEEHEQEQQQSNIHVRIPSNSWLLRLVLRYLECPDSESPLRVECLQVIRAMTTHFSLLRDHLVRLSHVLYGALDDCSFDVRLYGARCLDAIGFQMSEQKSKEIQPQYHLNFWLCLLPAIYDAYFHESATPTLKSALCDALSHMGCNTFESLPQPQRNGLLAFLLGSSSDETTDPLVRASVVRVLAVYVLHPTLRADLVFVEHAAELALHLTSDNQLAVRIKAAWALGNISDALVASILNGDQQEERQEERISSTLLERLVDAAVLACTDHDKVRANAVRSLGNLLRLLPAEHALMQRAMAKLLDCLRAAGCAKVKWNACYAIGNLVRNRSVFATSANLAGTLFAALSQLIVQHANFKVRINATAVLLQIEQRADFGVHYATMWRSLLAAIERSNALDTFEEYNHRDGLQQQLCLAMAHMLERARADDLLTCRLALETHLDAVSATWRRVAYRIVPEQSAPLFTCHSLLQQRFNALTSLTAEQRSALAFLANALRLES